MFPAPSPSFARLGLALLAAGSLQAATPFLNVVNSTKYKVEVTFMTPRDGGNDDNCAINLHEGAFTSAPQGPVDILNKLTLKNVNTRDLHPGAWTWTFTGFKAYCKPMIRIRILDGEPPNPVMQFVAKGDVTSSKVTIVDPKYSGPYLVKGVSQCFTLESGTLKITYPTR